MQGTRLKQPLPRRLGPKNGQVPSGEEQFLLSQHIWCSPKRAAPRPCFHSAFRFHSYLWTHREIIAKESRLVVFVPQDCTKQCNNCVPILTVFFLRAFLPLVNMHCTDAWLHLPGTLLCCSSADAEKHSGFTPLLLFVCLNPGVPGCADTMF